MRNKSRIRTDHNSHLHCSFMMRNKSRIRTDHNSHLRFLSLDRFMKRNKSGKLALSLTGSDYESGKLALSLTGSDYEEKQIGKTCGQILSGS